MFEFDEFISDEIQADVFEYERTIELGFRYHFFMRATRPSKTGRLEILLNGARIPSDRLETCTADGCANQNNSRNQNCAAPAPATFSFSQTDQPSPSPVFLVSEEFIGSVLFFASKEHSKSRELLASSSGFYRSKEFTPSSTAWFSATNDFYASSAFNESDHGSESYMFDDTWIFANSVLPQSPFHSDSRRFSNSNTFSETLLFSATESNWTETLVFDESQTIMFSSQLSRSSRLRRTSIFNGTDFPSATACFTRTDFQMFNRTQAFFSRTENLTVSRSFAQTDKFEATHHFVTAEFSSSSEFSQTEFEQSSIITAVFDQSLVFLESALVQASDVMILTETFNASFLFDTSLRFLESESFSDTGLFVKAQAPVRKKSAAGYWGSIAVLIVAGCLFWGRSAYLEAVKAERIGIGAELEVIYMQVRKKREKKSMIREDSFGSGFDSY
jgi:hypothetical protein